MVTAPASRKELTVPAGPGKRGRSSQAHSTTPPKVLIVDDEPSVCEFIGQLLHDNGYVTKTAYDASIALAIVQTFGPFELLLTDVNMPSVRGHELASAVRRVNPDIKVLYLTSYGDQLFKDKRSLWEGEAFIDKPVSPEGLLNAIALLLSR